jgi:hypothetical protein
MRQQKGRPARPKIGAWRLLSGVHVQRYTHNQVMRLIAMPGDIRPMVYFIELLERTGGYAEQEAMQTDWRQVG